MSARAESEHRDDRGDRGDRGGRSRRQRLPAAERRESILEVAAEVFGRAGYRAAKMSDIAAIVGVTEPVIFQNFGSKAGLFAAVVDRATSQIRDSLGDLTARFGSASALLAHVLTGPPHKPPHGPPYGPGADPATGPAHPGGAWGVLFADATTLAADPELAGPALAALRAIAAHLADLIERAQAENRIPGANQANYRTNPEAAAWLLMSVLATRQIRTVAMPPGLEPAIAELTLRAVGAAPSQAR